MNTATLSFQVSESVNESNDSVAVMGYCHGIKLTMGARLATLTIRNLPEEVRERLRVRAARRGRSMEAEVRAILTEITTQDEREASGTSLQEWVDELYGDMKPENVVEELILERRQETSSG